MSSRRSAAASSGGRSSDDGGPGSGDAGAVVAGAVRGPGAADPMSAVGILVLAIRRPELPL